MFSHTYDTCPLVVCDHEYCYFLPRFGLLHNTTHWGKIEGTRSLVLCLFSYSKHANGRIVFQVLLPFSPVRGELPNAHLCVFFQVSTPPFHHLAGFYHLLRIKRNSKKPPIFKSIPYASLHIRQNLFYTPLQPHQAE